MARPVRVNLDLESTAKIVNVPTPSAAGDAASKQYVDDSTAALAAGIAWKDSVRAASVANVTVASPGASLDGVTLTSGDRILLKDQSTASQNGIYTWNGAATPATRVADADTFAELEAAVVLVEEGTVNVGTSWRQSAVNGTIGSSSVTWVAFIAAGAPASESSAGIVELATQGETDTGTDDLRAVTPLKLATYANRAKRYAVTIGDGSSTQIDVTHNLGTLDVVVGVYIVSSGLEVLCDVTRFSTTVVRLNFASAPAASALRVVVVA